MSDVVDPNIDSHGQDRPRLGRVSQIATNQGGPISRDQLKELGFGRGSIDYWVACGRLHRRFRGVYLLGHEAITPKGVMMAAVLACGVQAVLSHRAASDWRGFYRSARAVVDVTVPGRSKAGQRGIDLHLVRTLDPRDVTEHEGVPITTVPRTLLDLAEVLKPRQLKRAVEEADRLELLDFKAMDELLGRSPGRHGLKPLRYLLADFEYDPLSRSEFEAAFFDFCIEYDLPQPTMNVPILGWVADAHWPGTNLVAELDGYGFHRHRAAFEADREKTAALEDAGYRVLRVTYRQLTREPATLARRIRMRLAYPRPSSPSPRSAARSRALALQR